MRLALCLLFAVSLQAEAVRGGALRVQIVRGGEKGPLTVHVVQRTGDTGVRIAGVRTLQANESSAAFEDLDAGTHLVLIEGDEPLKKMRVLAVVNAGVTRNVRVEIPKGFVFGRFTLGGRPLANAGVVLMNTTEEWTARLTTRSDGTYAGVLWRRGEFDVAVSVGGGEPMTAGTLVIPDGPAPNVDFDVPDRRVTGRVVTADGVPAPGVTVTLESEGPPRRVIRRRTDVDGEFSYIAVPEGRQWVRVIAAEGFLRPDPVQFELKTTRDGIVVKLANGHRRAVEVVDGRGLAIAGATVLCVSDREVRASATTDAKGVAHIDTPQQGQSQLYVIPREGSLAVQHLDGARASARESIRVRVPAAGAAIDLLAKTTEGTAVPEVAFMMRFNGELVPADVVREMQVQGARLTTDDAGLARLPNVPPGFYEFWPFRTSDEVTAILDAAFEPPIGFNARVGENRVTVRLEKRR